MSTTGAVTLTTLPPEILHHIASQIPLYLHPSTVAALSLLCRAAFEQFDPLLYTHLIFRDESSALNTLQALQSPFEMSRAAVVRSIHIRCADTLDHSEPPWSEAFLPDQQPHAVPRRTKIADVVKALRAVIKTGLLARLTTLEISLHGFWMVGNERDVCVVGFGKLIDRVCADLQRHCKALKGLHITGAQDFLAGDHGGDLREWFSISSIHGLKNLEVLQLRFQGDSLNLAGQSKLFALAKAQSASLRSLTLQYNDRSFNGWGPQRSDIFDLTFPQLQALCLSGGHVSFNTSRAATMDFFERHSALETLVLPEDASRNCLMLTWLTSDDASTFLPRLKHLSANWRNTRALAALIPRLTSLTIFSPYLDQIPYLFSDSVIPAHSRPLTHLKSLALLHISTGYRAAFLDIDGRYWSDGKEVSFRHTLRTFRPVKPSDSMVQAMKNAEEEYVAAVVAACPNLEELAIQRHVAWAPTKQQFAAVVTSLGTLRALKRVFFDGKAGTLAQMKMADREVLIHRATALAKSCRALEEVGLVPAVPLNRYTTAYISRKVTLAAHGAPNDLPERGARGGETSLARRVRKSGGTRSRSSPSNIMDDGAASAAVNVDTTVILGDGFGMVIGKDLDAFPTVSFPLQGS